MRKIMNISYTKNGDYLLPDLKISEEKYKDNLNKYGLLRLNFIKKGEIFSKQKMLFFYFVNFMS